MTDFFAELEGHLHDAARRRARRRWLPAPAPRVVPAVAAMAALAVLAFGALAAIDGSGDPEVAAPGPVPTPAAAAEAQVACGDEPPQAVLARFAVLRREAARADEAPPEVRQRLDQDFPGVGLPARVWPEAGRLARVVDGKRFWLFPVLLGRPCAGDEPADAAVDRPREPGLCWVHVDAELNMAICHPLSELEEPRTMVIGEGATPYVSALVPDGTKAVATDGSRIVEGTTDGNVFYARGASDLGDQATEVEPASGCFSHTSDDPDSRLLELLPMFATASAADRLPEQAWRDGALDASARKAVGVHVAYGRRTGRRGGWQFAAVPVTRVIPPGASCRSAGAEPGVCVTAAREGGGEGRAWCWDLGQIEDGGASAAVPLDSGGELTFTLAAYTEFARFCAENPGACDEPGQERAPDDNFVFDLP